MTHSLHTLRSIIAWSLTALGVALLLTSACTSEPTTAEPTTTEPTTTGRPHHHHAAPASAPPASMESIVAAAQCPNPRKQGTAADYRQVVCQSPRGRYTIMTFDTQAGKDAWLAEAEPYGGTYLVGDRWAVVSAPDLLADLRGRVGGELRGQSHGPHS